MSSKVCDGVGRGEERQSSEPNLTTPEQREALRTFGVSADELEQLWSDDGEPEDGVSSTGCGVSCCTARSTARDWSHLLAAEADDARRRAWVLVWPVLVAVLGAVALVAWGAL